MEIEQIPYDELQISGLNKKHELTSFESTNDDLNDFLKNDSLKDQEDLISRTYLSWWKKSIVGYFSILADTIEVQAIDEYDGIEGYLTVDSKHESISFYEKLGFKIVERYRQSEFPKMYLDMYPIVVKMQPKESLEDFENNM